MARAVKFAVVMVCMLCILAVCISPLVDLPATNLRSYQMAVILLGGLVAGAFSLLLFVLKPLVCIRRLFSGLMGRMDRTRWRVSFPMHVATVLRC
jgi:hypothetical protein